MIKTTKFLALRSLRHLMVPRKGPLWFSTTDFSDKFNCDLRPKFECIYKLNYDFEEEANFNMVVATGFFASSFLLFVIGWLIPGSVMSLYMAWYFGHVQKMKRNGLFVIQEILVDRQNELVRFLLPDTTFSLKTFDEVRCSNFYKSRLTNSAVFDVELTEGIYTVYLIADKSEIKSENDFLNFVKSASSSSSNNKSEAEEEEGEEQEGKK